MRVPFFMSLRYTTLNTLSERGQKFFYFFLWFCGCRNEKHYRSSAPTPRDRQNTPSLCETVLYSSRGFAFDKTFRN